MRAEPFHGNAQSDRPSCLYCSLNPRRLREALCSLGAIFVMACCAFGLSMYLDSDNTSSTGIQGKLIKTKFEFIEYQISKLFGNVETIQNTLDRFQSIAGNLDDLTIRTAIKNELQIYDADKTGITDFALEKLGGCVISTRDTNTYHDGSLSVTVFGLEVLKYRTDPKVILQPTVQPGDCWPFEGSRGRVVIKLMGNIHISSMSLEHIPKSLSPSGDISSAPKEVSLYGLACLEDDKPHDFGTFIYKDDGPAVQTFNVENLTDRPFRIVEVVVRSNHGNEKFTCLYRVRIHGKLSRSQSVASV